MKPSIAIAPFVLATAALSACTPAEPAKTSALPTQLTLTFTLPATAQPDAIDRALTRPVEQELRRRGETGAVESRVAAGSLTVAYESRSKEALPQAKEVAGAVTRLAEGAGLSVLQWRVTSTQTTSSKP